MPQKFINGEPLDLIGVLPAQGRAVLTPHASANIVPGRWFVAVCTVAGNVSVVFADNTTAIYPIAIGLTNLPLAIKRVNVTGTTATATYENWL